MIAQETTLFTRNSAEIYFKYYLFLIQWPINIDRKMISKRNTMPYKSYFLIFKAVQKI